MLDDEMKWKNLPPMPKPDSHIEFAWTIVNHSIVIAGGTTEKHPITKKMVLVGEIFQLNLDTLVSILNFLWQLTHLLIHQPLKLTSFCFFLPKESCIKRQSLLMFCPVHCWFWWIAEMVSCWKTSISCENHISWILERLVVLYIRTTGHRTGWSSSKEGHWRNVENEVEVKLIINTCLFFDQIILHSRLSSKLNYCCSIYTI